MSASSSPAGHAAPPLSRLLDHCADAVAAVRRGRSLTDALAACPTAMRPGTQALSFEVMRRLGGAGVARQALVPREPAPKVDGLLLSALALLWPTDSPPLYADHTLVDQAVTCAKKRVPAQAGMINAVLRRFLRERNERVPQWCAQNPMARLQHPEWWIERTRADWPEVYEPLLLANQTHAPMALRVNARHGTADTYLDRLSQAGLTAHRAGPHALVLDHAVPVQQLPGFDQGHVSVQDLSAQMAADLVLDAEGPHTLQAGARVLDACAAPGGKTAHLLERQDLDLLALDADAERLNKVQNTLDRLKLRAELRAADARQVDTWWDGRAFDAILLDAPCSASGIVRRHPDVRWLRRPSDIDALAQTQAELLRALWPTLKPGGRLIYATCSIFKAEGERQIDAFLQRTTDALQHPAPGHVLPLPDNRSDAAAWRVGDGFFYARLDKRA